jgi:1,4-alpha-glucan branching enzyme
MEEKKMSPQGKQSSPASNPWEKFQSTQTAQAQEKQVEFSLFAPQAKSVSVGGTFNRWNPVASSLKKDFQGNWKGSIPLKPGRYQYRFFVDGKWADDPKAKQTVPNEFGTKNAILEVK